MNEAFLMLVNPYLLVALGIRRRLTKSLECTANIPGSFPR